jgi:ABC-2 type transport system permease protein
MNIINKVLLWFVMIPSTLYKNIGVNTKHLRIILATKLLMDDRRPNTFHQTRQRKSDKAISAATIGTMIMSGFLGCLFLFSFRISSDLVTQFTIYFSLFFVMLVSTLISDFTSVLIDVRDNYIIFPKPVNDKTFVLSRLLHILMHITKIVVPMCLPGIIYLVVFKNSLTASVFFFMILLASVFSIFIINVFYLVILKFISPKKFQVIISYIQIFMTFIIFAGYQVIFQQVDKIFNNGFNVTSHRWFWLIPSYWFALSIQFFSSFSFQLSLVAGAALSILVPPLSLWAVIKFFAPSFNQKLSLITNESQESSVSISSNKQKTRLSLVERLAAFTVKSEVEKMGFLLTWKLTSRLRDFKLRVYPSIGYLLMIVVFSIYRNKSISLSELSTLNSKARTAIIILIYSSSFLLITALGQIQFSEKFNAAWFYFTTPIKKPGLIFAGAIKAVALKFYIPIMLILSITLLLLTGVKILPNIILGVSNVLLGCSFLSLIVLRNLPFSALQQTTQKAGAIIRSSLSLTMVGLLGFLQYIVFTIPLVILISIVLSGLANWLLMEYIKNKSWQKILTSYKDY